MKKKRYSMTTPQGGTYRKQERIKLVNDLLEYNKDPNVLQQWGDFFTQKKYYDLARIVYERVFTLFDFLENFRLEKKHRTMVITNEQANLRKQITETNNQKLKEQLYLNIDALSFETDIIARFPFTCFAYGQSEHDNAILEAFKGLINVTIAENPIHFYQGGKEVKSKDLIIKRDLAITKVLPSSFPTSHYSSFFSSFLFKYHCLFFIFLFILFQSFFAITPSPSSLPPLPYGGTIVALLAILILPFFLFPLFHFIYLVGN